MTILFAQPIRNTFRNVVSECDWTRVNVVPTMRRLFGVSTRNMRIEVLRNRERVVRDDWDYSVSVGTFSLAIIVASEWNDSVE